MLNPGYILDNKYEVIKSLGKGGMSTVYLCRNNRLDNLWAVKEVSRDLNADIDFKAEANILKHLNHSGIPRIIDIFQDNSALYIVEDFIQGETLKDYVSKSSNLSNETISRITSELCSILNYLHSFNPPIIHRDLKPSNIIIKPDGSVMLIDFGIARTFKKNQASDTLILGSRGYMAPEQIMNAQSNVQTDLYSLGAVMYYMATGKTASSAEELLNTLSYPDYISNNIISCIKKACHMNPSNRFKSAAELQSALSNNYYEETVLLKEEMHRAAFHKAINASNIEKSSKLIFLILSGFVLVIVLIFFISKQAFHSSKETAFFPVPAAKIAKNTETKIQKEQQEISSEKDIFTRGILYLKSPIILNSPSSKLKNKGKGKDKTDHVSSHLLYRIDPLASFINSNLAIYLYNVEVMDRNIVIHLTIENKSSNEIKLDLSKTYLSEENKFIKCNSEVSALTIPAKTKYADIKINFNDVELGRSSFLFKTFALKDINLNIDIK